MKYSFVCRKCGHTVMSNDKQEVIGARALHKHRIVNTPQGIRMDIPKCRLVGVTPEKPGKPMTMARPALAAILNARRA